MRMLTSLSLNSHSKPRSWKPNGRHPRKTRLYVPLGGLHDSVMALESSSTFSGYLGRSRVSRLIFAVHRNGLELQDDLEQQTQQLTELSISYSAAYGQLCSCCTVSYTRASLDCDHLECLTLARQVHAKSALAPRATDNPTHTRSTPLTSAWLMP